jgi:hypothetical protein
MIPARLRRTEAPPIISPDDPTERWQALNKPADGVERLLNKPDQDLIEMSLLDDITAQGAEFRERLRQLFHRHQYPQDTKTFLLKAYVDIAIEYHDAIWLLARCRLNGSAFAMVRLVYDAMFRAFWINKVVTDEQIERAIDDKLGIRLDKILPEIKLGYFSDRPADEAELFDSFLQRLKEGWDPMCSYTHSGALQLARRFTGDELKPNYSEGAIAEALNLVTIALLLLLHTFFVSMKCQKEAEEAGMDADTMELRGATSRRSKVSEWSRVTCDPALARLSAMISHPFIGRFPVSLPDGFPTQRNLSANVVALNDLLARVRCRETLCP